MRVRELVAALSNPSIKDSEVDIRLLFKAEDGSEPAALFRLAFVYEGSGLTDLAVVIDADDIQTLKSFVADFEKDHK